MDTQSFFTRRVLPGIAFLALLLFAGPACLPDMAQVERSIQIKAPIAVVFEQVNDLKKNEAWSPWSANDETLVTSYGATTIGKGASSSWTSENSGDGSMVITESTPYSQILIALDFKEQGKAESYWKFSEANGEVTVTWGFTQKPESIGEQFFALLIDSFIGPYYEEGLEKLKAVAEGQANS